MTAPSGQLSFRLGSLSGRSSKKFAVSLADAQVDLMSINDRTDALSQHITFLNFREEDENGFALGCNRRLHAERQAG
jgi:hypothetical protein